MVSLVGRFRPQHWCLCFLLVAACMQRGLSTLERPTKLQSAPQMSDQKNIGGFSANCSVPNSADDSADDENAGFDGDDDNTFSSKHARRMGVQRNARLAADDETEDDNWRVEGTDWQGDLGRSVDLPWPGHHKHRHLLIGVLTQPYYSWNMTKPDAEHTGRDKLFIGASYVRLLEAGGAQVVPVFHDSTDEEFEKVSLEFFQ